MRAAVIAFPPRDAGRVLDAAMGAADMAGREEAAALRDGLRDAGWTIGTFDAGADADMRVMQAALNAAAPILRGLTSDERMVDIVAHGMAQEVRARLHKAGVLNLSGEVIPW